MFYCYDFDWIIGAKLLCVSLNKFLFDVYLLPTYMLLYG